MAVSTDNDLEGKILKSKKGNKYEIFGRIIGTGGIGHIWRAWQVKKIASKDEKEKTFAIKTLHSDRFNLSNSVYWERFDREIVYGKKLQHPNLVTVIDDGIMSNNQKFLVMEYIEGKDLSQCIKLLNEGQKRKISLDIIAGLKEIHRQELVHRDLKPNNILITNGKNPIAKICDYGLMKKIEDDKSVTMADDKTGANTYISLHQRSKPSKADQLDDIYSLCICLHEIFSKEKWHSGSVINLKDKAKKNQLEELVMNVISLDNCLNEIDKKLRDMRLKYDKEQQSLINEAEKLIKGIPENYSLEQIEKIIETIYKKNDKESEAAILSDNNIEPKIEKQKKSKKHLIIAFVVILLIFGIFKVFPSKEYILKIEINCKDAQVSIIEPKKEEYKPGMKVKPGTYKIEVSCEGFKPIQQTIDVKDDKPVVVNLSEKVYKLTIKATPEDAKVSIVKPEKPYTPGIQLEPGEYHLKISRDGYKSEDLTINIKDRDIEKELILIKLYRLTIKAMTENVQVRIVKPKIEYKPGMELEPSIYSIEVFRKGFNQVYALDVEIKDTDITKEVEFERTNKYGMKFVYIPPGEFMMGSPEYEDIHKDAANVISGDRHTEDLHRVTISNGFYMQTTELTQGQWKNFMNDNPIRKYDCGTEEDCLASPVSYVSWIEVKKFIEKLNNEENTVKYRLPTEAEWEYTCRAGTKTPFSFGSSLSTEQANYNYTNGDKALPVGRFPANHWGLYDMHGNVSEWCEDVYNKNIMYNDNQIIASQTDPIYKEGSGERVIRGGSWKNSAKNCRSAARSRQYPQNTDNSYGFRLVMTQ